MTRRTMSSITAVAAMGLLALTACSGPADSPEPDGQPAEQSEEPQAWAPDDTVEMLTGSPGGGSDQQARAFEAGLQEIRPDVTMAIEAYAPVETYLTMKSHSGDPHKIMTVNYGGAILLPSTQELDYQWSDFSPVAVIGVDYSYVVTAADSPYETIDDLIAAAQDGGVTVGQVAAGGQNTILTQQFSDAIGAEFEPVVFEGGGQQVAATLSGDVDFSIIEPGEFIQQVEAGALKALVVLGNDVAESELLSSVPTAADAGLDAEFAAQWRGFFATPEIEPAELAWWVEAVEEWTTTDGYADYVGTNLLVPALITGSELDTFLADAEQTYLENQG